MAWLVAALAVLAVVSGSVLSSDVDRCAGGCTVFAAPLIPAGAKPEPAAQITAPTASNWAMNSSLLSFARQPGIDSSLSSVPPVCPSPRPQS